MRLEAMKMQSREVVGGSRGAKLLFCIMCETRSGPYLGAKKKQIIISPYLLVRCRAQTEVFVCLCARVSRQRQQ